MGFVTVYRPFMMRGAGKLVFHATGGRADVDRNLNPLSVHVKMTLVPERAIFNFGCDPLFASSERLNTVP
jgi:hypothetical protein